MCLRKLMFMFMLIVLIQHHFGYGSGYLSETIPRRLLSFGLTGVISLPNPLHQSSPSTFIFEFTGRLNTQATLLWIMTLLFSAYLRQLTSLTLLCIMFSLHAGHLPNLLLKGKRWFFHLAYQGLIYKYDSNI